MRSFARVALMALVSGVLSVAAAAQAKLDVPENLDPGETVDIKYSDPSRAGQKIYIDIDNGRLPEPDEARLEVQLDANGNGSVEWEVPEWRRAFFNAPGAQEVSRPIGATEDMIASASPPRVTASLSLPRA